MLQVLRRTLVLTWSVWPQLLAWYLVGWGLRYAAIQLAAWASVVSPVLGMLILPLGVLARLGSYVAMFLVLRGALPGLIKLRSVDQLESESTEPDKTRATEIFTIAILPFFTFYTTWKFLKEDFEQYVRWALAHHVAKIFQQISDSKNPASLDFGSGPIDISPTTFVICVIVTAFLGKLALKKFTDQLPNWTAAMAVYLEALWVFLAVKQMAPALFDLPTWLQTRRIIAAIDELRAQLMSHFHPIELAWKAFSVAFTEVTAVVLLPIAWLSLAGIIYARALAISEERRIRLLQATHAEMLQQRKAKLDERWTKVPAVVRDRSREIFEDVVSRFKPLVEAGKLILHAGLLPMSVYVLAYTLLLGAPHWLFMAFSHLVGPHELRWWLSIQEGADFAISAIVEPLRICLIAAAYNFCLEQLEAHRLEERREATAAAAV